MEYRLLFDTNTAVQLLLKPWDLWLLKWSDLERVLGAKLPVVAQQSTGTLEVTPIKDEALTSFWTLHFRVWLNTLMKSNRRFTWRTVTTGALRWCDLMQCATLRSDCIRTEADFIIHSCNDSTLKYYGGAHWKALNQIRESIPFFGRCIIIWLCLTRTRKYRIHEFNWLKLIMT